MATPYRFPSGLNCALGARGAPYLEELSDQGRHALSPAHPKRRGLAERGLASTIGITEGNRSDH